MCDKCLCKPVCFIHRATGGNVKACDHRVEAKPKAVWRHIPGTHYGNCSNCYQVGNLEWMCCPQCGAVMPSAHDPADISIAAVRERPIVEEVAEHLGVVKAFADGSCMKCPSNSTCDKLELTTHPDDSACKIYMRHFLAGEKA